MENKKYNTVGTIPKSQKEATLIPAHFPELAHAL